jgi:hypothetical protein
MPNLFASLQKSLVSQLETGREIATHSSDLGDDSERKWLHFLQTHLPRRYRAEKAKVIDHRGKVSDQIDIVIFDALYSPVWAAERGVTYVPAESVYAAIEVKQDMTPAHLRYAAAKVESVRRLARTTTAIPHAGGRFPAKSPFHILGIFLALQGAPLSPRRLSALLETTNSNRRLDLGCVVQSGSFEVVKGTVATQPSEVSLSFFVLRLLARLQALGTVPAIDLDAYSTAAFSKFPT